MSILLKRGDVHINKPDGSEHSIAAFFSDQMTPEAIAEIEKKKNEVLQEIPENYTELGKSVNELKEDLIKHKRRLSLVDGELFIDWEIGAITITGSGWEYFNSVSRIRTKENYGLTLNVGDTIAADNGYRFFVGFKKPDGTYGYAGWLTGTYTVAYNGEYCITATAVPETAIADVESVSRKIKVTANVNLIDEIETLSDKIDNVSRQINTTVYDGELVAHATGKYVSKNGIIANYDPYAYSEVIEVKKGDVVTAVMQANPAISAISMCNADYTGLSVKVVGRSYSAETYAYTVEKTGFLVLSYEKNDVHTCNIIRDNIKKINNSLESVNRLGGKKVVWCGDSIMRGNTFNDTKSGWAGRVADMSGCSSYNYGIGGACITEEANSVTSISAQIDTAHTQHPDADFIIFDGGCNDADEIGNATGSELPSKFGTWNKTDYSGNYDRTTFCGAFESVCYRLSYYWRGSHVGYIIPHKMGTTNRGYEAGVNNYRTYYETAVQICKKWGIHVLNMWDETYLCPMLHHMCDTEKTMTPQQIYDAGFLYADRQHLTDAGYNFEAPIVLEWANGL